jgi:hypothetical protein
MMTGGDHKNQRFLIAAIGSPIEGYPDMVAVSAGAREIPDSWSFADTW